MSVSARKVAKRVFAACVMIGLVAGVVLGLTYRQEIQDSFASIGYNPSARESQLMTDLDLTPTGQRIFKASHPTVDGSQHFSEQCAEVDHSEQGHVLGCFSDRRIHLFDVKDERVSGVVEVTAAHELLHAAYTRLGEGDRLALAEKLRREYQKRAARDPELKERMSVYEHLSDAAFANELHSVFGTEVRALPEWLEKHYAEWFEDRGKIVACFEKYHSVFTDLQSEAASLRKDMESLRNDIENRKAQYDADVKSYNDATADLNARNQRKEFAKNPQKFNQIRNGLAEDRADLEDRMAALKVDIDRYNSMRERLVALSELSAELEDQLDSTLAPISTRPDS
ncbi:hypothetical protein JD292_04300 [Leucobacter sp. CSA2]|uniref:Uncharacterized protein n=1 Tax=Leucobacter edaphi TaxID=2796472 RepID=A0A934QBD8_9MICO|nr:hypothetical protein [Leucobacter edaphi]MBK0421298.1 hypothetical protein [Leucobacter edaphi]